MWSIVRFCDYGVKGKVTEACFIIIMIIIIIIILQTET